MKIITGKQNSGKSLRAEELAVSYGKPLFYLATMKVMDEEGRRRVEKHRKQREGKGFITIECEYGIRQALDMIGDPAGATVLLECVANLVGNELYDNPDRTWSRDPMKADPDDFVRAITEDIRYLDDHVDNLIVVTSEYEADGSADAATRLYIDLLNRVNKTLSEDTGTVLLSSS
ncbi:MAG: bifunctional adenosylcobinamide kinase/adenosylcobinamide-phosphate guanylyltransferase [Lachnospiraceae bacterium]|nr:bifunctional adenosylcobinamide kinase/adenosylcobinamide-phosphate guanylyltransferase [Lachnospiraceae bacterium]